MTSSLPEYPETVALEKKHKPLFDEAFRSHPPEISEFTFTNLFAWRVSYGLSVSCVGRHILVRSQSAKGAAFFAPIGPAGTRDVMLRLLRHTRIPFMRVPEEALDGLLDSGDVRVSPDRDSFDYLYAVNDLVTLAGRKYDGKRNLIRKFKSTHSYEYHPLDRRLLAGCLALHEEWCDAKSCDSDDGLMAEAQALGDMIRHYEEFLLQGGAITVDGRVRAFCVAEPLSPGTLVVHMLKAQARMQGLYQCMLNEFLVQTAGDFQFVNLEQDLGIAGLRKAKESYYPLRLVRKYSVSPLD